VRFNSPFPVWRKGGVPGDTSYKSKLLQWVIFDFEKTNKKKDSKDRFPIHRKKDPKHKESRDKEDKEDKESRPLFSRYFSVSNSS
jgi:hypothetical protein